MCVKRGRFLWHSCVLICINALFPADAGNAADDRGNERVITDVLRRHLVGLVTKENLLNWDVRQVLRCLFHRLTQAALEHSPGDGSPKVGEQEIVKSTLACGLFQNGVSAEQTVGRFTQSRLCGAVSKLPKTAKSLFLRRTASTAVHPGHAGCRSETGRHGVHGKVRHNVPSHVSGVQQNLFKCRCTGPCLLIVGDGFLRHPVTKAANLFSGRCYRCVHLVQIVGCRFHLSAGALDQRGKLSTVCIRQRLAVIPCTTIQHLLIMCGVLFLLPCSLILVAVHGVQVLHKVQRILCCLGVCRSSPLHPAGEILVRPVSKSLLSGGCTDGLHPCIQCVHGVDVHVHLRLPALVFKADHLTFLRRRETALAGLLLRCGSLVPLLDFGVILRRLFRLDRVPVLLQFFQKIVHRPSCQRDAPTALARNSASPLVMRPFWYALMMASRCCVPVVYPLAREFATARPFAES